MTAVRMTQATRLVVAALLKTPDAPIYGSLVRKETGLQAGTLYPILHRLEVQGWLTAEWEERSAATEARPPRRYYRLTPGGLEAARQAPAPASAQDNRGWLDSDVI